jgi:hypothetical protein
MRIVILLSSALLVSACANGGIANRDRPDEFAVGKQAPLVIPPDYTLKPPRPGSPRPLAADSQQQALEALFGPGVQLPPKSAAEREMLDAARVSNADPMIRNVAGELRGPSATTSGVDKGAFLREILDAPVGARNPAIASVSIPGAPAPQ